MPLVVVVLVILLHLLHPSLAQSPPPSSSPQLNPSMEVFIVVVFVLVALFFVAFFSIYIRQCGGAAVPGGPVPRGPRPSGGLAAAAIESLPTLLYSDVRDHRIGKHAAAPLECAVCLSDFAGTDLLRLLPACSHAFHPGCIDPWLSSRPTCPVCRHDLSRDPPPAPQAGGEEERFALRLPEEVRREAEVGRVLHRSVSMVALPGRQLDGGSSRGGRRRLLWPAKSDRWLTWARREDSSSSTKRGDYRGSSRGVRAQLALVVVDLQPLPPPDATDSRHSLPV